MPGGAPPHLDPADEDERAELIRLAHPELAAALDARQDVVIAMTSPPYVLTAAVVHKILHPGARVILWSQDVYPDAAEEYGTVRRGAGGTCRRRG